MNHSILPLLIENHAHRFSCYNGWKISPESLEDFVGIRKKETIISKSTYNGLEFPELKEGNFIRLKTGAQLVPIGKFPELPKPKWIEEGQWEVVEFLKQDFIGIHLFNGPIPHEYPCYTRRRFIKSIIPAAGGSWFDPWKNEPAMSKADHEQNRIRQMKNKYNYNWEAVKKED